MTTTVLNAIFTIVTTLLVSAIYFRVQAKCRKSGKQGRRTGIILRYLGRKTSGFLILGFIPGILSWVVFGQDPLFVGLAAANTLKMIPWLSIAATGLIILNLFNSRDKRLQQHYPELRLERWNLPAVLALVSGWIIYLTGYEFLFRGLLLKNCIDAFGLWPAVAINLLVYFTLHLRKGIKEALATIPFGAIVIYLTIECQSIIPAILLHSIQAVSFEIFCILRKQHHNFKYLIIKEI